MNILITGPSSILGSACIEHFFKENHTLFIIDSLQKPRVELETQFKATTGGKPIDIAILTESQTLLEKIRTSKSLLSKCDRLLSTTSHLIDLLAQKQQKPKTLLLASSILIYERLDKKNKATERAPLSNDNVSIFFQQLEHLTRKLTDQNVRVLCLRFGKILSRLTEPTEIKIPFTKRYFLKVNNNGRRKINWVSKEDAVRAISFLVKKPNISGPTNLTSHDCINSDEYYAIIEKVFGLRSPTLLPNRIIRLLLGRELYEHFSTSNQTLPAKLTDADFFFKDIFLKEYLNAFDET